METIGIIGYILGYICAQFLDLFKILIRESALACRDVQDPEIPRHPASPGTMACWPCLR